MTIVVNLDPVQGGSSACAVAFAPFALPNPHLISIVQLGDLVMITGPNAVRQLGERLAERIRGCNESVDLAFAQVLMLAAATPSQPICFRVGDADAHALSWEAFVGNQQFMALDARWPIARIARGGNLPAGARLPFEPPLKLAAVLSAVGRPATPEWNGIYAAVAGARVSGLPIEVTLFAGEEDVIDLVTSLNDPAVEVRPVPPTGAELLDALRTFEPHLLHLYCHGTIDGSVRYLEIGTIRDFDVPGGTSSSVRVLVGELGAAMADTNTWLVVLNTCRGAEASDLNLTHAEEIVSSGVPVAVGMRRLIDADDAFAFSAAFYPPVFAAVEAAAFAPPGADRTVTWAGTLTQARRVLRDLHGADAATHEAWTLPVLYTRPGDFELVPTAPGQTAAVTTTLSETETLNGAVETLTQSAPSEVLDELRDVMSG
jgi:hypothetical protein